MKTPEEVRERLAAFQHAKEQLLCPPVLVSQGEEVFWRHEQWLGYDVEVVGPACTLESLNAEIAALAWVLSEASKDEWREVCETAVEGVPQCQKVPSDEPRTLGEAIPIIEAQARHVVERGFPK